MNILRTGTPSLERIFPGDSELSSLMRKLNWHDAGLGSPEDWPERWRTAIGLCLTSRIPVVMYLGPDFSVFYNDAYISFLGPEKHPKSLGRPGQEVWREIWPTIGPMLASVYETGKATWSEDLQMFFSRRLPLEEVFVRFTFGPILTDEGIRADGIFCPCTETTGQVLVTRRLETLRKLGAHNAELHSVESACVEATQVLGENRQDIPFAAVYMIDPSSNRATKITAIGLDAEIDQLPNAIELADAFGLQWQIASVAQTLDMQEIANVDLPGNVYPERTNRALTLPIESSTRSLAGFIIAGVSPRCVLDDAYKTFYGLVARHFAKLISDAKAYESERKRAEALEEIDRAKTAFFSNVSHEFRTPLTLILGPVDDMLAASATEMPEESRALLNVVQRNARRLLKLVNTLLDFARIESGRGIATYHATDLATFTADLASNFRSACERAGLQLDVTCPPLSEPAWLDVQMWETIVVNLLSNAFKFTMQGGIAVSLDESDHQFILTVRDTGVGISSEHLPLVFERFHRVENPGGRSFEGSGIGLALVQELAKAHGGSITVESEPGVGSAFFVSIPKGFAHLPDERMKPTSSDVASYSRIGSYVEEALSWLPYQDDSPIEEKTASRSRVLLADDNSDLRTYAHRLLAGLYDVEAVSDGEAALASARAKRPDLIVSDVMMPRLDGFGLLRGLRSDARLRDVPVVLLSARAGEEAKMEDLERGADDYLVKPFSARELQVRVAALLQSSDARTIAARDKEREAQALERLNERSVQLWRLTDLREGMEEMLASAMEMLGAQKGCIQLFDPERKVLSIVAHQGFGEEFLNLFHDVDGQDDSIYGRALRSGERVVIEDVELDAAFASMREVARSAEFRSVQSTPLMGRDGTPIGLLSTHWTIPHRPKDQDLRRLDLYGHHAANFLERCRTKEELLEVDRRKTEFIATLSHELRNPLAPLQNGLAILRIAGEDHERIEPIREMMERQLAQLVRLVDDVLEISRISRGTFELRKKRIDLQEVIGSALEASTAMITAEQHQLSVSLPEKPIWLEADAVRLTQVVANLLNNAAKYTASGGHIEVRAGAQDGTAIVSVSDDGDGIAADVMPRLFQMFSRGRQTSGREVGGLGIGLAISRTLTEMHGGTLSVTSDGPGKGSEFVLRLPLLERMPATEPLIVDPTPTAVRRILVVDDNRDAATSLAILLELNGNATRTAHDGLEAVQEVATFHPDVVLLDIGLPKMNGYEVARRVREQFRGKDMVLVALTGWGQEEDRKKSRDAGFDGHMVKPVDYDALMNLLSDLTLNNPERMQKPAAGRIS